MQLFKIVSKCLKINRINHFRFDTATVYINVTDANNYPPVFENAPYTASVFEDSPIGTTVLIVTASDGDVGQNAHVSCSI